MRPRSRSLVWLVLAWLALWESFSIANVLSGLAVGAALLLLFPVRRVAAGTGRLRPVRLLELVGFFVWKLLEANAIVAWEVITPSNAGVREGVVAVPMTGASDTLVAIVANAISLTPGTLTLEIERDPTVLYVHVLHLTSIDEAKVDVLRLERAVLRALGTDEAIAIAEGRLAEAEAAVARAAPAAGREA